MTTAAPPLSISFDGREYQTAGDSAGSPTQGGYTNEWQPNGNPKTGRVIQTPAGWSLPDQVIQIDLSTDDLEYLEEKRNNAVEMDVVVEYQDAIKGGTGIITGELSFDPMTSTCSVSLMGPGKFEKQ